MNRCGWILSACFAAALAVPVVAEAPQSSLRPKARGGATVAAVPDLAAASTAAVLGVLQEDAAEPSSTNPAATDARRPSARPKGLFGFLRNSNNDAGQSAEPAAPSGRDNAVDAPETVASASAAASSPAPRERPRGLGALFRRAAQPSPRYPTRGSVCGMREIRGTTIAPIRGRGACGIAKPVRVTEVSGVKLSMAATVDCSTAIALKQWIENGAKPTVGRRGGGIVGLKVAAHYSCRTRNSQRGARLSEHAKGKAIDIAAILLKNGSSLTVLNDWRGGNTGPIMRKLHQTACGPFGTVLGPNSDRFHRDHFHFDTASYRSGPYCR